MQIRRSPRILVAFALVAAALVDAGCGSSASTVDPVAQAAEVTTRAGGAQIAFTGDFAGPRLPGHMTLKGQGFFNYRTGEGNLSFRIAGLPAGALRRLGASSIEMTELMKSSTVYVSSDLFAGKLPGGARWVKLDLGRFVSAMGLSPEQLGGGQSNPAQFLQYLKAGGGSVEKVGVDSVRGVRTTRYSGSIDLERAAERISSPDRARLRQEMSKLTSQVGGKRLPVEVWIDDRHLVRRMTMRMPIAGVTITVELFDFGPTPTVDAPPARKTFDGTGAALGGLGSTGG